jgi:hypothetical protein
VGLALLLSASIISPRDRADRQVSWLFPYALALCIFNPVTLVHRWPEWTPGFVLLLAPLVGGGVVGLSRGSWVRAAGAWVLVFGQFFTLIHDKVHSSPVIGFFLAVYF